jgi:hypothetical protein
MKTPKETTESIYYGFLFIGFVGIMVYLFTEIIFTFWLCVSCIILSLVMIIIDGIFFDEENDGKNEN